MPYGQERRGTLVTRDELRGVLWPSDTFVDIATAFTRPLIACAKLLAIPPTGRAGLKHCLGVVTAS
jgi:hypothetical protein